VTASIDTNVLLRLILDDVPAQQAVAEQLFGDMEYPVTLDDQAIIEAAFALEHHYKAARVSCMTMLVAVMDLPTVIGDYHVIREAMEFWSIHPKLSLVDCYLAYKAAAIRATPLWTFDQKLANQHPAAQLATDSSTKSITRVDEQS